MKNLIVNADDYGRTPSVSRGIREAHRKGIVTSTTCMLNFPASAADIRIARSETPALGLGVHLVLTASHPLLPVEQCHSLVAADGRFYSYQDWTAGRVQPRTDEIRREWHAQIEAFITASGQKPSHLDAHHHIAYATAELLDLLCELAVEYGSAIRMPLPSAERPEFGRPPEPPLSLDRFGPQVADRHGVRYPDGLIAAFFGDNATQDALVRILAALPEGTWELMCHPGYADPELIEGSSYSTQRENELAVLTHPDVIAAIVSYNIKTTPFELHAA